MSKNLEKVIQRAISDAAFRRQLQSNPEAALRGFKLTDGEVAALRSGDAGKLTSLGIDQRMSKTFTFGAADLASRASTGGDLTSAGLSHTDQGNRLNSAATPGDGGSAGSAMIAENTYDQGQVIPGAGVGATSIGDPMSSGIAASNIGDPDNPASARSYVGEQAMSAPTSDAIENQSHSIAARQFGEATSAGLAAPIEGTPEEFSFRDQAPTPDTALSDPSNPAFARGFVGDQSDAFLSEGEVSSYSADPNASSDQAEDIGHAFNPDGAEAVVDDGDTISTRHQPDIPT